MWIDDGGLAECYFIAELGHNHQGDLAQALNLIEAAAAAGASAVKFQKRDNRSIFTSRIYNAAYESPQSFGATYGEHREALEFGVTEYRELLQYARAQRVDFMATAFDPASADFLAELGADAIKIASADLTNTPLLRHVVQLGLPLVVSTGGATMDDVRRAYEIVGPRLPYVAFLQCTAIYPAQPEDLDLRVIGTYREEFPDLVVGYSGHDLGADSAVAAYILGGRVVEKHFTLNRAAKGSDHHFSMEPSDFREMVERVSRTARMLGSPNKSLRDSERPAMTKMAKHIVAARDLHAGETVRRSDLLYRTAGGGMPPHQDEVVIGRRLAAALRREDAFPDIAEKGAYLE